MKPISPRPIFNLPLYTTSNRKSIKNSIVLAFSTQIFQSSHHSRRQEEESRGVRVAVWWDFENCNIPVNTNAFKVAQCITNAIRANGIKGTIQITAFGDVMQISRTNQEALSATGINLTHVPSGGKNSADRSLIVDLMYWVSQNPPPAHLFLISGDRDFAGILHRLRMSNYNILLASPDSAPSVLCSAATIMWQWSSLLKGEYLTGKLFNQPPDGPYNSWYGHYKAPIEDPFAVTEQTSCSCADKSCDMVSDAKLRPIPKAVTEQSSYLGADGSYDVAPDSKFRPIPKAVIKCISHILKSYPEGINISQLRAEFAKRNLTIDRDLYGYKKFSRFLSSMPHVLELYPGNDGLILVRHVNNKFRNESATTADVDLGTSGEPEVGISPKTYGERSSCEDVTEKTTVHPVVDTKVEAETSILQEAGKEEKQNESSMSVKMQDIKTRAHAENVQNLRNVENQKDPLPERNTKEKYEQHRKVLHNQLKKVDVTSPVVETQDFSEKSENQVLVPSDHRSAFGFGIFRRIWIKWFGSIDTKHDETLSGNNSFVKKASTSCQSSESVRPAMFSPSSHEALINRKVSLSGDAISDISSQETSLFSQIMNWFKTSSSKKFGDDVEKNRKTAHDVESNARQLDDDKVEKNGETADHFEKNLKKPEIFAKESFWKEMESFVDSPQGSSSISKSRTRELLAQNLQKQGPPVLRSLSESDVIHLVDLLISDKKWVEECESRIFPFRLTRPSGKDSHNVRSLSMNGLRHIFSDRQPNLQESGERKYQIPSHTGVPQPVVHRGSSSKPRSELLADCQKLVDQIVKEHPEGFNIGGFRKLFLEKHGYALDLQKLGYDKLVNLVQIMPGVRIESNLILPAGAFKDLDRQNIDLHIQESKVGPVVDSHSDISVLSTKDDDSDSSWDELGPVDNSGSEKDEIDTSLSWKSRKRRTEQKLPDYEPLREDDFSDSEEELPSPAMSENESKSKVKEEESTLLQILDSWYCHKTDDSKKDEPMSMTNALDRLEIGAQPSTLTNSGTKNESAVVKPVRKQKSGRSYLFVTEPPVDDKDKLVDGILGSLKKSGEKSPDSRVLS